MDKTHLTVNLIKFATMTISPRIFITKTRCNLEIFVNPTDHEELFVLLGCLGECVKLPRIDTRWNKIIPRTFGTWNCENWCLDLEKSLVSKSVSGEMIHLSPDCDIAANLIPSEIKISIFHPYFFAGFWVIINGKRQDFGTGKDFHWLDLDFNLSSVHIFVDHRVRSWGDDTSDLETSFVGDALELVKDSVVCLIHKALGIAIAIAEIEKKHGSQVSDFFDPSGEGDGLVDMRRTKFSAGVGAVHGDRGRDKKKGRWIIYLFMGEKKERMGWGYTTLFHYFF